MHLTSHPANFEVMAKRVFILISPRLWTHFHIEKYLQMKILIKSVFTLIIPCNTYNYKSRNYKYTLHQDSYKVLKLTYYSYIYYLLFKLIRSSWEESSLCALAVPEVPRMLLGDEVEECCPWKRCRAELDRLPPLLNLHCQASSSSAAPDRYFLKPSLFFKRIF